MGGYKISRKGAGIDASDYELSGATRGIQWQNIQ
jgi:hypothetical protein